MSRRKNIIWIFLLLISVEAIGQGSVVVHSDPRLAILLKKVHPEPVLATPAHKADTKLLASASIPTPKKAPTATVVAGKVVADASVDGTKPVDVHTPVKPELPITLREKPAVAATVHEHLWTPPALPKARAVTTGKGFRVQIYNGPDRAKAIEVKAEFMRSHPIVRTYLVYVAPHFRVRVGDFRNRGEAAAMQKEVGKKYSPNMIVPDVVTITSF